MINWSGYRRKLADAMETDTRPLGPGAIEPQLAQRTQEASTKLADAIVNGYVSTISEGGDAMLGAPAILNPLAVAAFYTQLMGLFSAPDPTGMAIIGCIVLNVPLCWTGATLNSISAMPLPGHVGHAPISTVLVPGVMPPFINPPASEASTKYDFIDNMIAAMKAHLLTVSGLHPAMILPTPAPPYPLPWVSYN